MRRLSFLFVILCSPLLAASGCTPQKTATVVHVERASYNSPLQRLTIVVTPAAAQSTGESYVDVDDGQALANYATYAEPGKQVRNVQIIGLGKPMYQHLPDPSDATPPDVGTVVSAVSPIPGVSIDSTMQPAASLSASDSTKEQAVIRVGRSKLGTPYIWGHNEDRGQYGFDCSNFTAYVYHHALGYKLSGASKIQYSSVGNPTSLKYAHVGDLVIFERGKHVGIYAGGKWVLQEGGGLGKVGYISIGPGSYWGPRITVVKHMF